MRKWLLAAAIAALATPALAGWNDSMMAPGYMSPNSGVEAPSDSSPFYGAPAQPAFGSTAPDCADGGTCRIYGSGSYGNEEPLFGGHMPDCVREGDCRVH